MTEQKELGVALIQEYNQILTKDEGQKQALLQVVSEHRKQFPDVKKSTVVKLWNNGFLANELDNLLIFC